MVDFLIRCAPGAAFFALAAVMVARLWERTSR